MTKKFEEKVVRDVQVDVARAQDSVGVPASERHEFPSDAIVEMLRTMEENDEAIKFLAYV